MALPKMQRVFAAAAVAALLMAGVPGRAEAAGTGTAGSTDAWSSLWNWALSQMPPTIRLWLGEDGGEGNNGNGQGRGAPFVTPPDIDKGSGLDPNGGDGGE
ncbi:MAG TPA: hypothetical protein VHN15_00675 [Thermoanaerobaculia bacterium]|nr:hypothetical protein [Thermoanaerobaculia bacterium]